MILVVFGSLLQAAPLSYDEAIQLALKNNQTVRSANAELRAADGTVMSAKSIFDPSFTVGYGKNISTTEQFFAGFGTFNTDNIGTSWNAGVNSFLPTGTTFSLEWATNQNSTRYKLENAPVEQEANPYDTRLSLNITQPLLEGFGINYNLRNFREAKYGQTIAQQTARETREQVVSDVAKAYWRLYYQQRLEEIAKQSVQVATEEKRIVEAKVKEGQLASIEADRVEASLLLSKSNLIDAQNTRQEATEALLLLLNKPLSEKLQLSSLPVKPATQLWDMAKECAKADKNNYSIARLHMTVQLSESRLRDARHKYMPDLSATAQLSLSGWEEEFDDAIAELVSMKLPGQFIGLNLNIPLLNWGARGEVQQRKAELSKAKADLTAMNVSIHQQVRAQIRILQSAKIKSELAQANLKVAQKTLAVDRALRDAGRKLEKDVLDAIRTVEDARGQVEKSTVDYQLAMIELLRLQGNLLATAKPQAPSKE